MRIAVVGTGAMGSIYAARLALAGHQVWAVDTWQDHVDAINDNGLTVESGGSSKTVPTITAVTSVAEARGCDLYIIATKADHVGEAAREIAAVLSAGALVLTIQNGLGSGERISRHMPTENVLLGVAEGFGAAMVGPGHARHAAMKQIRLGELGGGITPRLSDLVSVWQNAGFFAQAFENINQLIWEKFLCNVALSGPCTAFNCTVEELMVDPEKWRIALGCMREAYRAGVALDIEFSFADPEAYVTKFATPLKSAGPSMLQDMLAGRKSELDAINGQVPQLSARLGFESPYNDTICAVIRSREAEF
jgi:2-dehydropantoate 2-reductase